MPEFPKVCDFLYLQLHTESCNALRTRNSTKDLYLELLALARFQ
eukprot:Gb_08943 [translate_table: standard]